MFYKYPYTNLYNLNLDWLIQAVREIQDIIAPLESGLVNSVNGMHGNVVITKEMLIQILENLVSTFNGRTGDVTLTAEDVNETLIDITWTSDPGDTIADLTQTALDDLYQSGKRVLIFVNSQGVADRIYFLQYYDSHAQPQELATVASFNGRSGNVTLTAADVNGTMIANTWISDPGDTIADLTQTELDELYQSGKRILIFLDSQGIADRIYFFEYYGGHAHTVALAVVPTTRTVNNKPLTSNITINSSDVPSMAIPGTSSVETALMSLNTSKVPTTRTVNGKALSANITLNDENIPSGVVSGQTTVEGVLTNLDQRATSQAQQIENLKRVIVTVTVDGNGASMSAADQAKLTADMLMYWHDGDRSLLTSDLSITPAEGSATITGTSRSATTFKIAFIRSGNTVTLPSVITPYDSHGIITNVTSLVELINAVKITKSAWGNAGRLDATPLFQLLGDSGIANYVYATANAIRISDELDIIEVVAGNRLNTDANIAIKYVWNSGPDKTHAFQSEWQIITRV